MVIALELDYKNTADRKIGGIIYLKSKLSYKRSTKILNIQKLHGQKNLHWLLIVHGRKRDLELMGAPTNK